MHRCQSHDKQKKTGSRLKVSLFGWVESDGALWSRLNSIAVHSELSTNYIIPSRRDVANFPVTWRQVDDCRKNGLRHNVRHYKLYGDKMADSDSEDELRKVLSSSHGFAAECQFKAVIYRRRRTVWVRTYIWEEGLTLKTRQTISTR